MLRTALKPRWLGLLALVIVVMVGFVLLGRWQWAVAQDQGTADATRVAAEQPTTPLTQVLTPGQAFPEGGLGRRVTVTGRYLPGQVLITGRQQGGRDGYWVVTPLQVEGAPANGQGVPTVAILRGFVTTATAPAPPAGRVAITGQLEQGEPAPDQFRAMPAGQMQTLSVPALLNRWGGQLYNGFVMLGVQDPAVAATDPTPVPPPAPGVTELNWRNLGYALQWYFFAAFALYMWWRMVREDHLSEQALRRGEADAAAGPAGPDRPGARAPTAPVPDAAAAPPHVPLPEGGSPR